MTRFMLSPESGWAVLPISARSPVTNSLRHWKKAITIAERTRPLWSHAATVVPSSITKASEDASWDTKRNFPEATF